MRTTIRVAVTAVAAVVAMSSSAFAQKTLEAIKARGEVVCGVSTGLGGFSVPRIRLASGPGWMWIFVKLSRPLFSVTPRR